MDVFAETEKSAELAALATTAPGPTLDCYGGFIEILSNSAISGCCGAPLRRARWFRRTATTTPRTS